MSDPLDTHEQTSDLIRNRNGDVEYAQERNRVRAMPPVNPTQFSNEFLNRTRDRPNDDGLFVRGPVEENTSANQRTIQHSIKAEQMRMKQIMNQAIAARKEEYNKLSVQPPQVPPQVPSQVPPQMPQQRQGITLAPLAVNEDSPTTRKGTVEGFTSPGKVLGQQESLLYSNETIDTQVLRQDYDRAFKQKYRRYYEDKMAKEQKLDRLNVASGDPLRSHNLNYQLPPHSNSEGSKSTISRPGGFGTFPKDSIGNQLTNPHEDDRYNKPNQTVVTIDSRDRDRIRYPNANQFKISLGAQFRQVKRVVIQSTEFPNTDVLIRDDPRQAFLTRNRILLQCGDVLNDANNHLYWLNDEDAVSKGIYDCLFYTADLTPGNYTGDTLAAEIENKVSQINHFIDGTPSQFIVDINTQTNVVRFLSVESVNLAIDPVFTTIGTNLVTISQPGHSFSVGELVTITNSTNVGGISAEVINQEHIIKSITGDTYTFQVTQVATSTTNGGGGNVLSGKNKPIKLLFSNIDTFGSILGFPQQDSADQIANDIEFINIRPPDLSVYPYDDSSPGTLPAWIKSTNHNLTPGDEILILNTNTIPNINGIQTVTKIITPDEFEIGIPIKVVNNQTETLNTVLGTMCKTTDSVASDINTLTTAIQGNIITTIPHNFNVDDLVFLANIIGGLTTSGNDINEVQTVSANIDDVTFDIVNGILYEGTDFSGAFVFKTDSTISNPISGIIPQNNGVIEPSSTVPIFTGSQVPQHVFFTNMGNTSPILDGNIFDVSFYSTDTGRFDLTVPITINQQLSTQSYIRSRDSALRTIVDAFQASNGTFRLSSPHNLTTGDYIYVRSLIPTFTTSEPRITPDITGILSVNTIFDTENFDTTTTIISALFDTEDIAFVQTDDKYPIAIQNIYPMSNNYLAKDINSCKFPDCALCEDSLVYIFNSFLRIASTSDPNAAIAEETTSTTLLDGIRTTHQVFNGQSKNFTHIFDLTDVILDVVPIPVSRVQSPSAASPTHTITFFYNFSQIMDQSPTTTGTIVFGGTSQLGLSINTTYSFTFQTGVDSNNTLTITDGNAPRFVPPFTDTGILASGTFYVSSISINEDVTSPLGSCALFKTGGGSDGTNGEPLTGTFSESASTILANTYPFLHGLSQGDRIFVVSATFNDPTLPYSITNVSGNATGTGLQTITIDVITHDLIFAINNPGNVTASIDINGHVSGPLSELRCANGAGTISGNALAFSTETGIFTSSPSMTVTYPTNTIDILRVGTSASDCPGAFPFPVFRSLGAQTRSQITSLINPAGGSWTVTAIPKEGDFMTFQIFGINVIDSTSFQIALPTSLAISGFNGEFTYHRVCGDVVPLLSYFGNSWPGMFESQNNNIPISPPSNIYIGKATEAATTPVPIDLFATPDSINGVLGNTKSSLTDLHPFENPLNFHFFTSVDLFTTPIIIEEINAQTAEFVNITANTFEFFTNIEEITPANNGLIESSTPHGFVGGETLYFLENVNINNGVANDFRENFLQVGTVDATNPNRFSLTVPITKIGTGNVGDVGTGNFFYTYENESLNKIQNISGNSNGTLISVNPHSFDTVTPTSIFITDDEVAILTDLFTNGYAFKNPAPLSSTTEFTTDVIITPIDIDPLGSILDLNNHVDIINTNNQLLPQLNGIRWVRSLGGNRPIFDVNATRKGTLSPVKPGLSVGDSVYIISTHPTTDDLNGIHTVSYIDLDSGAFFELADITLTDIDGVVMDGEIKYFSVESAADCVTINSITPTCPTIIRAANHGFVTGSIINLAIFGTSTTPSLNLIDANVIVGATVLDSDEIELPLTSSNGSDICVDTVINATNTFINQQGQFSKQILSTNCGIPYFEVDPMNGVTIVTTDSRSNLNLYTAFPIYESCPLGAGATKILTILPSGTTDLPFNNGDIVLFSGHIGGKPHIDGEYKVYNVSGNAFSITSLSTPFDAANKYNPNPALNSVGTGGYVTGPSNLLIDGHGLFTGDLVEFNNVMSDPPINNIPFEVTVISDTQFTIPVILTSVNNQCKGEWCSDVIDMNIPNHGLVDGDTFFLYGAQNTGGILPDDLNTIHGDKRMNVPTKIEQQTQKTVRVIDDNNIQFHTNGVFPVARILSGGYTVCISSNNHTNAEKLLGLKNYGFKSIQTNQDCLGSSSNFIDLSNESYILLVSDILNHILNTGPVRNIFAKIQLSSSPNQVAYNSFVTIERLFDTPIVKLDEVDFELRRHDGKLFDLRGRDWSISLLIEEYRHILRNAEISSRTGIADRGAVSAQGFIESTISAENPQQNVLSPTQFTEVTNLTQRVNK